jgi:hypothetical protein
MLAFLPWPIENDARPIIAWRTMSPICRMRNILLLRYIIIQCVLCRNRACIRISGRFDQDDQTVRRIDEQSVDISRLSVVFATTGGTWRPWHGSGLSDKESRTMTLEPGSSQLDADSPVISRFADLSS